MMSVIQYQTELWTQVDKFSQSYQYNNIYNIIYTFQNIKVHQFTVLKGDFLI